MTTIEELKQQLAELDAHAARFTGPEDDGILLALDAQKRRLLAELRRICPHPGMTTRTETHRRSFDGAEETYEVTECHECGLYRRAKTRAAPLTEDAIWR